MGYREVKKRPSLLHYLSNLFQTAKLAAMYSSINTPSSRIALTTPSREPTSCQKNFKIITTPVPGSFSVISTLVSKPTESCYPSGRLVSLLTQHIRDTNNLVATNSGRTTRTTSWLVRWSRANADNGQRSNQRTMGVSECLQIHIF